MKTTQATKITLATLALLTLGTLTADAQQLTIGGRRFRFTIGRPAPVIVGQPTFTPNYYWTNPNWNNGWNNNWNINNPFAANPLAGNPFVTPVRPIVYHRPAIRINGTWRSRYGRVVLVRTGNRVTGTIFKPNGRRTSIRGRIIGRTIKFTWRSSAAAYGKGQWRINGRRRMTGSLTNIRTGVSGTFNLRR